MGRPPTFRELSEVWPTTEDGRAGCVAGWAPVGYECIACGAPMEDKTEVRLCPVLSGGDDDA